MAGKGFRVHGADLSPRVVRLVAAAACRSPASPASLSGSAAVVAAGLLTATTDTTAAVAQSDVVVVVVPLVPDAARPARLFGRSTRPPPLSRPGLQAGHAGQLRDHAAGQHHAAAAGPALGRGLRPAAGARLRLVPQPRARVKRAGSSPTCGTTRSWSAGSTHAAASGPRLLRVRPGLRRAARSAAAQRRLGSRQREAAELAKLAETTYRDVNIGLANQFARFAARPASTSTRSSRRPTASRSATSTGPASPSAGTASRSTRGSTCGRPAARGSRRRPGG